MNKELLLKVADAIEANPEHFSMDYWYGESDCGTTACIVGWAFHLHKQNDYLEQSSLSFFNPHEAFMVLDIYDTEKMKTLALVGYWRNEKLKEKFNAARIAKTKAKYAAEYVRWFVENAEKET